MPFTSINGREITVVEFEQLFNDNKVITGDIYIFKNLKLADVSPIAAAGFAVKGKTGQMIYLASFLFEQTIDGKNVTVSIKGFTDVVSPFFNCEVLKFSQLSIGEQEKVMLLNLFICLFICCWSLIKLTYV